MVKKSLTSRGRFRQSRPAHIGESVYQLLRAMGGDREKTRFGALWENWAGIVGEEIAALVAPAGHKDRTLLLEAEDALAMQEASMRGEEVLSRVNAYLESSYFERVKLGLPGQKGFGSR